MEKTFTQLEILDFFRNKKMLTSDEAAAYLNLSTPYIRRLANQQKINNYDPGDGTLYYDVNSLDNYLRSRKKMTESEIDTYAFKYIIKKYKIY